MESSHSLQDFFKNQHCGKLPIQTGTEIPPVYTRGQVARPTTG